MPFTPLNQPAADINGTSTSTMAPDSVDDMDPQVEQEEGQDVVRLLPTLHHPNTRED